MSDIATQTFDAAESEVQVVDARWVASYEAKLANGTALEPGETVVQIPLPEALASGNWEVLDSVADLKKVAKKLGAKVPSDSTKAEVETLVHDGIVEVIRASEDEETPDAEAEPSESAEAPPAAGDESTSEETP
jgi:nucleotide-binding universal stress UspA family protein